MMPTSPTSGASELSGQEQTEKDLHPGYVMVKV